MFELSSFDVGRTDQLWQHGLNMGGVLYFAAPAPAGGATVLISTNHPTAVTVPGTVSVPAGATSASVWVMTHAVAHDTDVQLSASLHGATHSGTLRIPGGTFLAYASIGADPLGGGRSARHTLGTSGFSASTDAGRNGITIHVEPRTAGATWVSFQAPSGSALGPGRYDGAARTGTQLPSQPGLDVQVGGFCQTTTGWFEVLDVAFGPGPTVARFHARFAQSCFNIVGMLFGEVLIEP